MQQFLRCAASVVSTAESLTSIYLFLVTVKVGIGGFSMGAAMALYSATCYATGRYGNGNPYPLNLRAVVGLSGWLPGARYLIKCR